MTQELKHQAMPSRRRLLATATALCAAASVGGLARAATKPRVIPVVARKFDFVPAEIRVRRGETVTLSLTAPEVPMGINIADLGVRADIIPGKPTLLTITPEKAGRFTFLCDVFCGSGHEDMSGTLIVT